MKVFCAIFLMVVCATEVSAQTTATEKKFYLMPQAGLLKGDNANSTQASMMVGIRRKDWSIGLGSAVDYYKVRTIPVFADIRKKMNNKKLSLFTYADIGCDLPYPTDANYWQSNGVWSYKYDNTRFSYGFYSDIGFGYTLLNKKNRGVLLSLGYSVKTITKKYSYPMVSPIGTIIYEEERQNYYFNRLLLKMGVRL